jgi:hypothetical protein
MNETNIMTPEAIALQVGEQIAKQLDGKSDRYIMIYTAVMLIVVLGWMAWYFLKRQEKMQEKADEKNEQMVQIAVQGQHVADSCRNALDNNNKILQDVNRSHERVIECLRNIERKQ